MYICTYVNMNLVRLIFFKIMNIWKLEANNMKESDVP